MKYGDKKDDCSIVVLGAFKAKQLNPSFLHRKGVLNDEDYNKLDDEIYVSDPLTRFKVKDKFEFLCQGNHVQISSNDISQSANLQSFIKNLLECLEDKLSLNAIGVNAGVEIVLGSDEEGLKFANHFALLNSLSDYMENPRLNQIILQDNVDADEFHPRKTIFINSIGIDTTKVKSDREIKKIIQPKISIRINNHFNITNKDEAEEILLKAEQIHTDFRDMYKKIMSNI